jgi:pyruvate dehydrogenase E2 component (dihydrolipoamide acetyltransferase)
MTADEGSQDTVTPANAPPAVAAKSVSDEDDHQRVAASGYAKRLAKDQGIDLKQVIPSRPDGYITSSDLTGVKSKGSEHGWMPPIGEIQASPLARKLAIEHHIDLAQIKGSGPFNRITSDDVLKATGIYIESSPLVLSEKKTIAMSALASPAGLDAAGIPTKRLTGLNPMTTMQKAVSKNMEKSLSVPVFRVTR